MRNISAQAITDTVARLCIEANIRLPQDVQAALDKARQEEPWPLAKNTLNLLWSNLSAAREKDLPICQDTGMACVFVELGTDVHIDGSFEAAIHEGVRRGYTDGYLRKSIVADPLRRGNTGDNTPAAITVHLVDGDGCTITVAPKGFGSENMSRIQMLKPADGVEGFRKFVLETVQLAGSNPCPPIVLGIGVGGSRDGNGEPWFVARKDLASNTLWIVQGHEHPWLNTHTLKAVRTSWVSGRAPEAGSPVTVKTRYRAPDGACEITAADTDSVTLAFPEPQWAATPGQSAVLYRDDVCLGGGFIDVIDNADIPTLPEPTKRRGRNKA